MSKKPQNEVITVAERLISLIETFEDYDNAEAADQVLNDPRFSGADAPNTFRLVRDGKTYLVTVEELV